MNLLLSKTVWGGVLFSLSQWLGEPDPTDPLTIVRYAGQVLLVVGGRHALQKNGVKK